MSENNIVTYLADKLTVDEIKELVEFIKTNSKDSDIVNSLNTIATNIDTINTNANTAASKSSSNATDIASVKTTVGTIDTNLTTANTNINSILSKLSSSSGSITSCIRNIQNGTFLGTNNSNDITITLTGFTNVNKMFVLLDGDLTRSNSGGVQPYLKSLTLRNLTIGVNSVYGSTTNVSYQVIEFY